MHPNLVVFKDREEAEDWVWAAAPLLKTYKMQVVIVANPTDKRPDGCSVLFQR